MMAWTIATSLALVSIEAMNDWSIFSRLIGNALM
jgi:hypothetical protein